MSTNNLIRDVEQAARLIVDQVYSRVGVQGGDPLFVVDQGSVGLKPEELVGKPIEEATKQVEQAITVYLDNSCHDYDDVPLGER